jgi:hypothetical protein
MKKKIFRRFTIAFVSLVALSSTTLALACAIWFDEDEMTYSFFAPETSRANTYAPFYRSLHLLYKEENYNDINNFNKKNAEEWAGFFKGKANQQEIETLLYNCGIGMIDSVLRFVEDKNYPCDEQLKKNAVIKIKDKKAVKSFLQYLYFAKSCEPYATYSGDPWDDRDDQLDLKKHPEVSASLITNGEKLMTEVNSGFIKQRYAFQLTRLYFLCDKFEECLGFYEKQVSLFSDKYSIRYRAMGYAAGALYKLKRYSEANYLYSLIYDQCGPLKISAYNSFHPLEEPDWQACLDKAKSNREKMVIWQLMGIYADPLRAMKEIYKTDPSSDLMDLLLTRAVNLEEEKFLPLRESYDGPADTVYNFKTAAINKELVDFIKSTATKENTNKPYLWNLTAGYLSIVQGTYKTAEEYLAKVKEDVKNDTLVLEQVRAFEVINRVEQEQKLDTAFESKIVMELMWLSPQAHGNGLRNEGLYHWLLRRLSEKYTSIGEVTKAQCLHAGSNNYFYEDEKNISKMLAYMDKPHKTIFDYYILSIHPYKKTDVFDLQGTRLLYQYKFKEAVSKFEESPGSGGTILLADPFVIHINDCHDCDFEAAQTIKYSKLTFAKKMLALQNKWKANPKNAAVAFDLANGYYNMTYFGNSRLLYQSRIKHYPDELEWDFQSMGISWFGDYYLSRSAPMMNCEMAATYYKNAMELSNNTEFKATCCFMAAKTEQNAFYISKDNPEGDVYFKMLKNTFNKTNYYKEVIKECRYFAAYVNADSPK